MTISGHVCLGHPYLVVILLSATSRSIINPTSHFISSNNVFFFFFFYLSFFVNEVIFNVMTGSEMYDRQSNNYLANYLLLLAESLTN